MEQRGSLHLINLRHNYKFDNPYCLIVALFTDID